MAKNDNLFQKNATFFIDATNLCYWQDTAQPSLNVLLELLYILKKSKEFSFYCIFDANTHYKLPIEQREIYQRLLEYKEYFYQVTGGKKADDFILELADSYSAPVISNDNYNDPHYAKYRWKERDFTPKRLFMGEVIPLKGNTHLIISELDIHVKISDLTDELFKKLAALIQKPTQKQRGRIKFFNAAENWGLIVYETDLYFQPAPGMVGIQDAYELEFTIGNNDRGPCADNISIPPVSNKGKTMVGVIESYDDLKTFGYIRSSESAELLFFYKSYVPIVPNEGLYRGMAVEFIPSENKNGKCAREIRIIPETEELKQLRHKVAELENLLKARENTISQYKRIKTASDENTNPDPINMGNNIPNSANQPLISRNEQVMLPNTNDNLHVKEVKQLQLVRKNEIADNKEPADIDAKLEKEKAVPVKKVPEEKKVATKKVNLPSPQQKKDLLLNRNKQNAPNKKANEQETPLPETQTNKTENPEQSEKEIIAEIVSPKTDSTKQIVLKRTNLVPPNTENNEAIVSTQETPNEITPAEQTTEVPVAKKAAETPKSDKNKAKGKTKEIAKETAKEPLVTNKADIEQKNTAIDTKVVTTNAQETPVLAAEKTNKQTPKSKTPAKTSKKTNLKSVLKQKIDSLVAKAEKEVTHIPIAKAEKEVTPANVETEITENVPAAIVVAETVAKDNAVLDKKDKKKTPSTSSKQNAATNKPQTETPADPKTTTKLPTVVAKETTPPKTEPVAKSKAPTAKEKESKKEKTTTTRNTTEKSKLAVEKTIEPVIEEPLTDTNKAATQNETTHTPLVEATESTANKTNNDTNKKVEPPVEKTIPAVTADNTPAEVIATKEDKPTIPQAPIRFATAEYFNDAEKRTFWWAGLQLPWRMAFNVFLEKGEISEMPTDEEIKQIFATKRFSFHHATKNRLTYKLTNLQGVHHLTNITELNISEHAINSTKGIEHLDKLNYLGCSRNELSKLEGVENLTALKQLYVAKNNLSGSEILRVISTISLNLLDCRENNLTDDSKKQLQALNIKELKL